MENLQLNYELRISKGEETVNYFYGSDEVALINLCKALSMYTNRKNYNNIVLSRKSECYIDNEKGLRIKFIFDSGIVYFWSFYGADLMSVYNY